MPFTISHAAASLPIRRIARRLPLDALVVGTMAPDFEYVLRLSIQGKFGHTPVGLVLFCLPVSLVVVLVWRALVVPALLDLAPPGLATRLRGGLAPGPGLRALTHDVPAVLLGAASHVLWDGFTHETGWFVQRIPELTSLIPGTYTAWYVVLQHGSTLLGGIVLLAWVAAWLHRQPRGTLRFAPGQAARALRVAALLAAASAAAALLSATRGFGVGLPWTLGYAAVGGMAGLAVSATAYGLAARLRAERRTREN